MICGIAPRSRPILVRSTSDVRLATNDRLHAGALRFLVKFNRAKQIAMVGHGNSRHFEFSRLFHQFFHPDTAVQERVFSVQMQMNERVAGHQFPVLSVKNFWQIYEACQFETNRWSLENLC